MSIGIDRRARSRRAKSGLRAVFGGKAPEAQQVADRLHTLAKRMLSDTLRDAAWKNDRYVIKLAAHPAAPPAKLIVETDADITLKALTASVGPGYHAALLEVVEPVLDELDYEWLPAEVPDFIDHRDLGQLQERFLLDLADRLRRRGDGQLRLSMPAHLAFRIDAPVLTALGPRDDAWCAAVLADPEEGADAFPWWDPKDPGALELSRALTRMWLDVPWREPIDDAERRLMERVDADLRAAWKADPTLALPWADWAELLDNLDADGKLADRVRKRAGDRDGTIGYRRYNIDVEASGGWSLVLPGNFVGTWDDDDERYVATDGERTIELATLTATSGQDAAALIDVAKPQHPVIARFVDGARVGRAEVSGPATQRVVHGLMACAPHVALLTCHCAAEDEAWALDTWRSLRNSSEP